jgi:hypothetical protein
MIVKTFKLVSQEDYNDSNDIVKEEWQENDEGKNYITLGNVRYASFDFAFYAEDISSVQATGDDEYCIISLPEGTCIVNVSFCDAFDMMMLNEDGDEDEYAYDTFSNYIKDIDPENALNDETKQFMNDVFDTARVKKSQIIEAAAEEENNDEKTE